MKQLIFLSFMSAIPLLTLSQEITDRPKAVGLTISLPWINNYIFHNHDLRKSSSKSGFVGIGAAVFYKTGAGKFSFNFGFTGDVPVPFGPIDYAREGTRTNILSNFGEALYHRRLPGRLSILAGINYIRYRFNFTSYVDSLPSYARFDRTIGLTAGIEYRFSKNASLALFYRPTVVSFDQKQYRHLLSIDARFDINLWRNN